MVRIVAIGANLKDWVKKKKPDRKRLKKQLDELWAELVKKRAGYKCERSGKTGYLNSHHVFSRSNLSVRWNLDNGVCLNAGRHTLQTDSAHKNPIEFIEWIKDKRGIEWYEEMRTKANQVRKWTIIEMEEKVKEFQEMIKQYEED